MDTSYQLSKNHDNPQNLRHISDFLFIKNKNFINVFQKYYGRLTNNK